MLKKKIGKQFSIVIASYGAVCWRSSSIYISNSAAVTTERSVFFSTEKPKTHKNSALHCWYEVCLVIPVSKKPEYVEPLAQCVPGCVPKSLYWHGYEIRQYPGYVVFFFNSGTRIIHLDNKPHLPANIKL